MTEEEWGAMHLESHNILPEECEMCLRGEGIMILKLYGDKGNTLCHESEVTVVKKNNE